MPKATFKRGTPWERTVLLFNESESVLWGKAYEEAIALQPENGCDAIKDEEVDPAIASWIKIRLKKGEEINIEIICASCRHMQYCTKRAGG